VFVSSLRSDPRIPADFKERIEATLKGFRDCSSTESTENKNKLEKYSELAGGIQYKFNQEN
jgi:hypothetical protein